MADESEERIEEKSEEAPEQSKHERKWCIERTELEKGLTALLIIAVLLITTLGVLLVLYTTSHKEGECPSMDKPSANIPDTSETCTTQICSRAAFEILTRIDTTADHCTDFYKFACGNAIEKPTNNVYKLHTDLIEKEKFRITKMFREPIQTDDHFLIKIQKIMYEACINETTAEKEAFQTLKQDLKTIGGWPVVEENWNETRFNWLQTTYKLRLLGYPHNSFLDVTIVQDPKNTSSFIFQVVLPAVDDIYSELFDSDENHGFMADVAVAFGAHTHRAVGEMSLLYQFLKDLQWLKREKPAIHRATVEEFQKKEHSIDWLQFLNNMVGFQARISKSDVVIFPHESNLDPWLALIDRTPKRILSNYMLWRVVQKSIPFVTKPLRDAKLKPRFLKETKCESRSDFCITEINRRFAPSPIHIMYLRKSLPEDKRQAVEIILNNIKGATIGTIENATWLGKTGRNSVLKTLNKTSIIIGAPGNYFDDRIFEFNIDVNISSSFFDMLIRANRNKDDRLFGLITRSPEDTTLIWRKVIYEPLQFVEDNDEYLVGASLLQDPVFNQHQPNYLNYGNMGAALNYYFLSFFRNLELHNGTDLPSLFESCILSGSGINQSVVDMPVEEVIAYYLGTKITRKAYENWAKDNPEPNLLGLNLTPEQMFWTSSGYFFCRYNDITFTENLDGKSREAYATVVSNVINTNVELLKDFQCKNDAKPVCELMDWF